MSIRTTLFSIFLVSLLIHCAFAESDVDVFADGILNDFKTNNYENIYNKSSEGAKEAMSYDVMVRFLNLQKEILGDLERYEKLDSIKQTIAGRTGTTLRYAAHFENTGAIIVLVVIEKDGQMLCQTFHTDCLLFNNPRVQSRFTEVLSVQR